MPKLTQYTRRSQPTAGQDVISSTPGSAGIGLQQAGADVADFAKSMRARASRKEVLRADTEISDAGVEWTRRLAEGTSSMEAGGVNFTLNTTEAFDAYIAEREEKGGYETRPGQDALERGYAALRAKVLSKSIVLEASAASTYEIQQHEKVMDTDAAAVRLDPEQFPELVKKHAERIAALGVPGNAKDALITGANRTLAYAALQGLMGSNPEEARRQLEAGEWNEYITPERIGTLLREADAAEKAESRDAMIAQSMEFSRLTVKSLNNELTRAEVDDFKANMLADYAQSGTQWAALERALKTQSSGEDLLTSQISYGTAVLAGAAFFNPGDNDQKKAMDSTYIHMMATLAEGTPQERIDLNRTFVRNTGYIPKAMENRLVGQLTSPNFDISAAGAIEINSILRDNPYIKNQFSDEDTRRASLVGRYIDMGERPADAAQRALDYMRIPDAEKAAYDTSFAAINRKDPVSAELADAFDPGLFSWEPDSNIMASAEYTEIVKEHYRLNGGDMAAAKLSAVGVFKKTWGSTGINGDQALMKYAPENYYSDPKLSLTENSEWMRDQMVADVRVALGYAPGSTTEYTTLGFPSEVWDGPTPDMILFLVHPRKQGPDGRPMYSAVVRNVDGTFAAVMTAADPSKVSALFPDVTQSPAHLERKVERDEAEASAAELRAAEALPPELQRTLRWGGSVPDIMPSGAP